MVGSVTVLRSVVSEDELRTPYALAGFGPYASAGRC